MHGQENELGFRPLLADLAGGVDAIEQGHADVQNDEVRLQAPGGFDQSAAVFDLADDIAEMLKQAADSEQDQGVIVGQ